MAPSLPPPRESQAVIVITSRPVRSFEARVMRITTNAPALLRGDVVHLLPSPSRETFERLSIQDPELLAAFVYSSAHNSGVKAKAAEILGEGGSGEGIRLLVDAAAATHLAPLVREGAVRGLAGHTTRPEVVDVLRAIADNDSTSPGLRETAREVLDDE